MSHSARGAWIETLDPQGLRGLLDVALREGCVDRNREQSVLSIPDVVALREGCVDRNSALVFPLPVIQSRTPRGVRG